MRSVSGGYELLEHTADVGIHAWGDSPEEALGAAAKGLVDVLGAALVPDERVPELRSIEAEAEDVGALVVDFLNELVLLHESEEVGFLGVRVERASATEVRAVAEVLPMRGEPAGIPVKAATYHRLEVIDRAEGGWDLHVYLDV